MLQKEEKKKQIKLLIEYLLMIGLSSRTLECSPQFAKSCGAALNKRMKVWTFNPAGENMLVVRAVTKLGQFVGELLQGTCIQRW